MHCIVLINIIIKFERKRLQNQSFQNKSVYIEINSQVEAFFRSQGFSMITIQPEFPPPLNSSLQELPTDCALKCKVCTKKQNLIFPHRFFWLKAL